MSDQDPTIAKEPVIDLRSVSLNQNIKLALLDLLQGIKQWRIGWKLGLLDIKLRYRGSILGPLWITIIMGTKITTIGILYAFLLHLDLKSYFTYVSISIVLWTYISSMINDSCNIFTNARTLILSQRIPFSICVWRTIFANILILGHNLLVIIVVFTIFKIVPHSLYLLLPATFLWIMDSLAIGILFGILGTRFKDIPPIISAFTQAFFFITPIIWKASSLHFNSNYILLNPFYPLFEIVRSPILGESLSYSIWLAAIGYSLILWILALFIFSKTRFRIPYWM
ncbi:ABC transporter permease [Commensalibacter papalotli (ex Servin-Garciduenas et al. 2014)]|uniref:ABC transporter permease n=1 Tax=Commensalibacter papalotli (ex Servin-Garciduenas et al. 2014) TaxID=1208583 RepID=W7DMH9_9PROT|nr:ABC transporter permease [Commensalibacter papalotli (ex Servin-Garciduenas et al. 2014)]EUK18522.1 ABC transporter permease [Commensalibacter papalotli (ex Servin-Garciduenas et al. 2014)]